MKLINKYKTKIKTELLKLSNQFKEIKPVLKEYKINNINIKSYDYNSSTAIDSVCKELKKDCYNIEHIPFEDNDIVMDIGAHVGVFSIYLAKKFPFIKIYSYEPIPENYENLAKNIEINNVKNITIFNKAITGDRRTLDMSMHFINTGGATAQLKNIKLPEHSYYNVESLTLDDIFETQNIKKCKLLKIDCEGSEYEILFNSKELRNIEYLSGEFHINEYLKNKDYSIEKLYEYCKKYIKPKNITYTCCYMAE